MLDVTGGKLTTAGASSVTKSSSPKTLMTVASGSNRRPSSPSPLRYGIGILSQCLVKLPGAFDVVLRALLEISCARLNPSIFHVLSTSYLSYSCGRSVWFVIIYIQTSVLR